MKGVQNYYYPKDFDNIFNIDHYKGDDICNEKYPYEMHTTYPISKSILYILNLKNTHLRDILIIEMNDFMIKNGLGTLISNKKYYEHFDPLYVITLKNILAQRSKL